MQDDIMKNIRAVGEQVEMVITPELLRHIRRMHTGVEICVYNIKCINGYKEQFNSVWHHMTGRADKDDPIPDFVAEEGKQYYLLRQDNGRLAISPQRTFNKQCHWLPDATFHEYYVLLVASGVRDMLLNGIIEHKRKKKEMTLRAAKSYLTKETFQVNDRVMWKESMQTSTALDYGDVAVVLDVMDTAENIVDTDGISHWCDIVIGFAREHDESFHRMVADSSRLTHYKD